MVSNASRHYPGDAGALHCGARPGQRIRPAAHAGFHHHLWARRRSRRARRAREESTRARGEAMNDKLLNFYRGTDSDNMGRRIESIWGWDFTKLESVHDYIQWLFPLAKASQYNPDAPLLDAET